LPALQEFHFQAALLFLAWNIARITTLLTFSMGVNEDGCRMGSENLLRDMLIEMLEVLQAAETEVIAYKFATRAAVKRGLAADDTPWNALVAECKSDPAVQKTIATATRSFDLIF
jgi:hypothetical protein